MVNDPDRRHDVDDRYVLKADFMEFRAENREQHGLVMIKLDSLTKHVAGLNGAFKTLASIGGILGLAGVLGAVIVTILK